MTCKTTFLARLILSLVIYSQLAEAGETPAAKLEASVAITTATTTTQALTAAKVLEKWNSKGRESATYKKYFEALSARSPEKFWQLYQELSKSKKLLKLQHDSIKKIIEIDLEQSALRTSADEKTKNESADQKNQTTKSFKNFDVIAKRMLKNLRGQPEGLDYELNYLKWILQNKKTKELCTIERQRWLSQKQLNYEQVVKGLESCPLSQADFLYRMRLLIFSGAEEKARSEISLYNKAHQNPEWQRAYFDAVFYTNMGDPVSAFNQLSQHEKEISQNEEFYLNYFYISQRAGQQDKAEEVINKLIKTTQNSSRLTDLRFQKALLFYQTKRYDEAVKILSSLVKSHKSHTRKKKSNEYDDLTWLLAWNTYLKGDFEKARDLLLQNAKWTRDKARNQYWLAQAELGMGNIYKALEYYRVLATPILQGRFFNYYNYIAWLKFENHKNEVVSDMMKSQMSMIRSGKGNYLMPDHATAPRELLAQYESYVDIATETDQGTVTLVNQENSVLDSNETEGIQLQSSDALKIELSWADDLTKWGYRDIAKWHLYEVEKNLKTKSDVLPLAQYYLKNQYYYRAVQLMQKVANPAKRKLSLAEEEILWLALFPKAYEKNLKADAKTNQINPYLVWSIMKAETQFKSDAISPVGAVGLMQFMPYTSQKVAVLLKEKFDENALFQPEVAVRFGARYLKKLSDELGGQPHLVSAAYNGGPHRVKLWLRNLKNQNKPNVTGDVFIEHIPFNETRTYVKRVLNFYLAYQKIYEDKFDFKSARWIIESLAYEGQEPLLLKEEWPQVK